MRFVDVDRIDWRLIIPTNATTAEENMIYRARKLVEFQPTADVVEVVRCKDCKWNKIHITPRGNEYHICEILNSAFDGDDDFYCSYGERREDAN